MTYIAQVREKEKTFGSAYHRFLKEVTQKHPWFEARREIIFSNLSRIIMPPAYVLDIGCGVGGLSKFLAERGYKVVGCDLFYEALEELSSKFKKVQADAFKLPFKDNSFDLIGLFDVLEHFSDDAKLFKEALRIVKDGGFIVVTVPARKELWSYFDEFSYHKRRYSKGALKKLIETYALKPIVLKYMFFLLYLPMWISRMKRKSIEEEFNVNFISKNLLKIIFKIERYISQFLPLFIGTSLIAIAQKGTNSKIR